MHSPFPVRLLLLVALLAGLLMTGLARAEQYVVTAFGDSITSGYPYWTGTDGNGCLPSSCGGGYRAPLQTLLQNGGRNAVVQNWGRPRCILLLEGTNELYYGSAQTVRDNLAFMIDKAAARGVTPILGTFSPDPRYPEKNIPAANALLKELALNKNIALADHYAALIDNWSRLSWTDGFHPNTAGYATMAQVWFDAMKTPDLTPILMLLLDE
jgi:lysophospholipase L1-like esterase